MGLSLLGSATCSVLDFVRTDLRTMLAIAWGIGRPHRPCPALIASRIRPPSTSIGRTNERAWKDHSRAICY